MRNRLAFVAFVAWVVIFCAGALGELLGGGSHGNAAWIEWLREVTDFKRVFLR